MTVIVTLGSKVVVSVIHCTVEPGLKYTINIIKLNFIYLILYLSSIVSVFLITVLSVFSFLFFQLLDFFHYIKEIVYLSFMFILLQLVGDELVQAAGQILVKGVRICSPDLFYYLDICINTICNEMDYCLPVVVYYNWFQASSDESEFSHCILWRLYI